MSESRRPISDARTLSAEERADLVRLLRRGSWRPFGGRDGTSSGFRDAH